MVAALSWKDDRIAMTILGFNSTRSIVSELYKPGARYVCGIEQIPTKPLGSQIGFGGQGGIGVVASRAELTRYLEEPPISISFCVARPIQYGFDTVAQRSLRLIRVVRRYRAIRRHRLVVHRHRLLRLHPTCSLDCKRARTVLGRNATSRTSRHDFYLVQCSISN